VLEGKTSNEIAESLFISVNTVHTHRRNILKKTGAGSIVDLLRINQITDE
jgi:DNA-binding CsgD family transcriptional regulator